MSNLFRCFVLITAASFLLGLAPVAAADPLLAQQWGLTRSGAPVLWPRTDGAGVMVAVLDTGVSPTHLDLKTNVLPGYDFLSMDADARDDAGHGTQVAGILAAARNNGQGGAGVCPACRILPVKVLSNRGTAVDATVIAAGIRYAVERGARIINVSFGSSNDAPELRAAVAEAQTRGALIVAAAGYGPGPAYPAAYPGVLAVAATDQADAALPGVVGPVGLAAPGVDILTTIYDRLAGDGYAPLNGTSAAAPHVSGAAALLLALRPDLSAAQVADILQLAAADVGLPGWDAATGHGRLDIAAAANLLDAPDALQRSVISVRLRGAPAQTLVQLSNGQSQRIDAAGVARFAGLAAGQYVARAVVDERTLEGAVVVNGTARSQVELVLDTDAARAQAFVPVSGPGPGAVYFPQTGHTLSGAFRRFWESSGGLAVFGYPLSEPFSRTGTSGEARVVQYFERHVLELHPEQPPPYSVLLARLGAEDLAQRGIDWQMQPAEAPRPGCVYFAATGRNLCEPMLSAWRSAGIEFDGQPGTSQNESLALFGLPLTAPQEVTFPDGTRRMVQWFERARFEDHGALGVLFGLLGAE